MKKAINHVKGWRPRRHVIPSCAFCSLAQIERIHNLVVHSDCLKLQRGRKGVLTMWGEAARSQNCLLHRQIHRIQNPHHQ